MINYKRRASNQVQVGQVGIGGENPIRVQSMLNTFTTDTDACVAQSERLIAVGCEIIRLTTQGVKEAANTAEIKKVLREKGYNTPLVADVHFNPAAAEEAALHIEKVRINPGNFANTLEAIQDKFTKFLALCKEHGTAIRIGVNHGSLNPRMMQKYGDTPEGMTESCMEFLRICKAEDFNNVVISVKASNTRIMVQTVRQIVRRMNEEGMNFPLHLGVTEAGEGEDGRIKSAVGIGTLLQEGIGDTIRVSLSEDPEKEIPVAKAIVDFINKKAQAPLLEECEDTLFNGESYSRRITEEVGEIGGGKVPVVVLSGDILADEINIITLDHANAMGQGRLEIMRLNKEGNRKPVILKRKYETKDWDELCLEASMELGAFFIDGLADGICIEAPAFSLEDIEKLSYSILQAARARQTKTEYISCPSCGRTLFDIQETIAQIKAKTSSQTHLKIGIMGCIVNGPGEMADADYGYVGAARGKISLYKGKECIEKNIPQEEAVEKLVELIKSNGDWVE
ncbi:MAG: (E)-4-hydroxy-3-methylbut-2-enyl-diphosphate synthase [Paludibacteraceae bacterium]|nr:(E)-4-hydroxy-3-methylbut-2-enyl-diphosphate synthase [Paludibacteraceae bacterium]